MAANLAPSGDVTTANATFCTVLKKTQYVNYHKKQPADNLYMALVLEGMRH